MSKPGSSRDNPLFKSTAEAVEHCTKRLQFLADKRNMTISELFDLAEHSPEWDDELEEAHQLYCTRSALKRIEEKP